jgi:hypothetical protein
LAVDVQPVPGSVTVNVYVPAVVTEGVPDEEENPPGPVQAMVAPDVEEDPFKFTEVVVHVKVRVVPVVALGAPAAGFTTWVAVEGQPALAGSVTVTVYVPAALTKGFCNVDVNPPGPLQLYVTPGVVELPLRETEVIEQVSVCVAPALAFGAAHNTLQSVVPSPPVCEKVIVPG